MLTARDRVLRIRDALDNVASLYDPRAALFYPIADALQMVLQRPLVLAFLDSHGRCVFSTLADPQFVPTFLGALRESSWIRDATVFQKGRQYALAAWHLAVDQQVRCTFRPLSAANGQLFAEILRGAPTGVRKYLASAFEAQVARKEEWHTIGLGGQCGAVDAQMARTTIDALRGVLDAAVADCRHATVLQVATGSHFQFSNLLCVLRQVTAEPRSDGRFPYTARVLLSAQQRDAVLQKCERVFHRSGGEYLADLESPLEAKDRSIADSVFTSGVADFSAEEVGDGRDQARSAASSRRQHAEALLYRSLTGADRQRVVFVPIHIGGSPWLALYSLWPARGTLEREGSWLHNYTLHRNLIPMIASRLRLSTQRIHVRLVTEALAAGYDMATDHLDVPTTNRNLERLGPILPFPRLQLRRCTAPSAQDPSILAEWGLELVQWANPFFPAVVPYGRDLDKPILKAEVDTAFVRLRHERDASRAAIATEFEHQGHTLKNCSPTPLIQLAQDALDRSDLRETQRYLADAARSAEVSDLSIASVVTTAADRHPMVGMSVAQFVRWLEAHTLSIEKRPKVEIDPLVPEVYPAPEKMALVTTVLWNLWNNAGRKHGDDRAKDMFVVRVRRTKSRRTIALEISNDGTIPEPWRLYLLDRGPLPYSAEGRGGLRIVKDRLQKLGWRIADVRASHDSTSIRVEIPTIL